jgi:hypothetical protein
MSLSAIELRCNVCDQPFLRTAKEVKRNESKGRPFYCSRKCAGVANFGNIRAEFKVSAHLQNINRRDEFSRFRTPLRIARKRAILGDKEFNLSLEILKALWETQQGFCPYTGWKMILPASCVEYNRMAKDRDPRRASIDRIDSARGYTIDNIQFVCHMANVAKNEYSHLQMLDFCQAIAFNQAQRNST